MGSSGKGHGVSTSLFHGLFPPSPLGPSIPAAQTGPVKGPGGFSTAPAQLPADCKSQS